MDINDLRSLSTVLMAVAFFAICWWAFAPKRRKRFDDAAQLPFADEPQENQPADPAAKEQNSQQPKAKGDEPESK